MPFTHNGPLCALFFFSLFSENVDTPQLRTQTHMAAVFTPNQTRAIRIRSEYEETDNKKCESQKPHFHIKSTESTAADRIFIEKKKKTTTTKIAHKRTI